MEELFKSTQMRILAALALLMAVIALGSYASLNFEKLNYLDPMPTTITVTGEGEVLAIPDVGTFSFAVTADGFDAPTAQEESGTKVNDILAFLAEQNIAETDIKTQNYNLNQKWKYEQGVCFSEGYCPTNRVEDGYTVSQRITVKVRETDIAAAVIGGVGERGATNISSLNFTVDDTDALRAEARAIAITDAREKAVVLAEQLGVQIVRLSGYYENNNRNSYEPYYDMRAMGLAEDSDFGGAELPMGEEPTSVEVSVIYTVK
jgi:hypothetical protein